MRENVWRNNFYWILAWISYLFIKSSIRFCHSARNTKSLKLDLWLINGLWHSLKNPRGSSTTDKNLWHLPSFNYECNFKDFAFYWKWQDLIIRHLGGFLTVITKGSRGSLHATATLTHDFFITCSWLVYDLFKTCS